MVTVGQSIAAEARSLGVVEQTLFNWVKAERQGKLKGADSKVVSADNQTRLHSTLACVSPVLFEQHWPAAHAKQVNS